MARGRGGERNAGTKDVASGGDGDQVTLSLHTSLTGVPIVTVTEGRGPRCGEAEGAQGES